METKESIQIVRLMILITSFEIFDLKPKESRNYFGSRIAGYIKTAAQHWKWISKNFRDRKGT